MGEMRETTGENVRKALRLMSWADRRALLVVSSNAVKDEAPTSPLGVILEAIRNDILLAEDEERALVEAVDDDAS